MRIYTAHLRENTAPVLLREGFSLRAMLLGPLWLLMRRAWIPAILILCLWVAVATLPQASRPPVGIALAWLTGLFGRDLARWSLERRGYRLAHVLAARDEEAAYARLLAARPDLASEELA